MEFEWDEAKAAANVEKHGITLEEAIPIFFDNRSETVEDRRWSYGEARFVTTGYLKDRLFVVVHTPRHGATRIISARRANARERRRYGEDRPGHG